MLHVSESGHLRNKFPVNMLATIDICQYEILRYSCMPILSVPCKQSFLSCMACSANKVIHVAIQESNLCSQGNLSEHILQQTSASWLERG